MFNPYTIFIGIRYAGAKRRSELVSFISLVSMTGMAVAVALLILVLSVMNGFDKEMRQRILGLVPHITITSYNQSDDWQLVSATALKHSEVAAAAPFAQLNVMIKRGNAVEGLAIYGIKPSAERSVSIIHRYVDATAMAGLTGDSDGILLGAALAKRLAIEVGDSVNIIVPRHNSRGRLNAKLARLTVLGLFDTGTEIDQALGLISMAKAMSLMDPNNPSLGLRLRVKDTFAAARVGWEVAQNLPLGYSARDWTRSHGNLYSAIQMSKQLVGLMLLTIIAVAAFNVISALVMIVTDKRPDIAILRTLGASRGEIMAVFIIQGTLIALVGTAVGVVIGAGLALSITDLVAGLERVLNVQFLNSDVYPVNYLPADLRWIDVQRVCGTAFLMSLVATLYPAWRASKVPPAEALRLQ